MKAWGRKRSLHKFMLVPIFLIVAGLACIAAACGGKEHSHEWQEHAATDSTCTVAGHELYYTCSGCDKIFDAQKNEISAIPEKPLLEHVWDEGVKTADADCEHGDAYTLTCSVGGETKIEYRGEPLGHAWGEYEVTEDDLLPDCEHEGTKTAVCTRCHDAYNTVSTPALGHNYGALIARENAQTGTIGSPCQTGLEAHYFCDVCKNYFDENKQRTTLDALVIDLHDDESNLTWNTTEIRHEHVCIYCAEKIEEGEHAFSDWSTFTCSVCNQNVEKRSVYAFNDIKDYCRSNWEPVRDYKAELTTLPQGIGLPENALDMGDKALCFTANRDKGEGKYQIWPALYIGGLKDIIANAANSYKLTVWIYATADAKAGVDNWFVFGDATLNEDGYYFNSDISSQSPLNRNSFAPEFTANSWYPFTMTVAEIKSACAKQGRLEAEWIHFSFEATEDMKLYFYSAQLYPEQTYTVEKPENVHTYVKGVETTAVLPLSSVRVEVTGLEFGKGLKVTNGDGEQVAVIYGSTGNFVMPHSNVTIEIIDVLNVPLDTLNMPLYSGNISLPETHQEFCDSYTVVFKKDGKLLDASKYTYNETTHVVTFTENGTYTVEYTLTKEGQSNIPVLKRNVNAGVLAVYDSNDKFVKHGWGGDYNGEAATLPNSIGRPQNAMDAGNVALKFVPTERNGNYQIYPAIEIGNLTYILENGADGDYISIWLYMTVAPVNADNWYMVGNKTAGDIFGDVAGQQVFLNGTDVSGTYTGYPDSYGGGSWFELKFTVKELKDQIAHQGTTLDELHPEWLLLSLGITKTEGAAVYVYSAEYHKVSAYEIDATGAQGVSVAEKALPLSTVEVDLSNLEYGKAVKVINAETSEVIATIYETGSFTMPFANVKLEVIDVFDITLSELELPLYSGSVALPEEIEPYYDSYTLTVKKNGEVVNTYTFDPTAETIEFSEAGVYELTYTLTQGDKTKELTRTVTVGVITYFDSLEKVAKHAWTHPDDATDGYALSIVEVGEIGIPTEAINVGNKMLKLRRGNKGGYDFLLALRLSGVLENISQLRDCDGIAIWIYCTEVNPTIQANYLLGNLTSGVFGDDGTQDYTNQKTAIDDFGTAGAWYKKVITFADLKAQLKKQGRTDSPDWLLLNKVSGHEKDTYFYSIEFVKEVERTIDISGAQGVSVAGKALPLSTVEVDASNLGYGKVVEVKNAETSEVIALINGTGSFVMPFANVILAVTDVFERPLDDLQFPVYSGSIALPEEIEPYYDSYTLTVKKNDEVVNTYTFDSATQTITFCEAGVYELIYTLTQGEMRKELTCNATVGVINSLNDISTMGSWWWVTGENWVQEIVDTDATIGKPQDAADIGNKLLKCELKTNNFISPVFALGDFLKNLDDMNDCDSIRIWMYYTNTWGGPALHYYAVGQQNISDAGDKTSALPSSLGSAGKWVALDITIADIKDQIEKGGSMYGYNAESAWLHTMMNVSGTVYFYSIEFAKGVERTIDATGAQGVSVAGKAFPLSTVEVDASNLDYGKAVKVINAETSEVIATIYGTGSFKMPFANVKLEVIDVFDITLSELEMPLYSGSVALPEEIKPYYDSYTLTVKKDGEVVSGYAFDSAAQTIEFSEAGVYELTYTLTQGDRTKELTRTVTVGSLIGYSGATVPNYVDYCTNQIWNKGDAATAHDLTEMGLSKPTDAIDVGDKVLRYMTTADSGYQVVHALKVPHLTEILTNGKDDDYISVWMYRTGGYVSDNNFYMIGNAQTPYEWAGNMYVNYDPDNTDGQKMFVDGSNKSGSYSSQYADYSGGTWFELKFTVKELKDQLEKQGADLATMQPQWIMLSFGLQSKTDAVYYYSMEYHKA